MSKPEEFVTLARDIFKSEEFIPLHAPVFSGNEKKYVLDTLDSTFVSSVGAYVNQFEKSIADVSGAKYGIAVVNGTAALQVALGLVGVSSNDEVITQALSFVATANAIKYNGAHPVFLDVDRDTMGMSPVALKEFLNEFGEVRENGCFNKKSGKRISACVPMHTFGFICRIQEIVQLCQEWHIPVVEDAAEGIGSVCADGCSAGTLGSLGVYSFNGNKIITAGGGGAIITNDTSIALKAKHLTTTAKVSHKWEYVHDELGYNFRMPNINAALVLGQLEQLPSFMANKKTLFAKYSEKLDSIGFSIKEIPETTKDWNYWLMAIELENESERDNFLKITNELGVMTRPIWKLLNELPMYRHCQADSQVNAKFLAERIVNIPSSVRS